MLRRWTTMVITGLLVGASQVDAGLITTFYGDDDGFGVGITSGSIDATVSNASPGEAVGTDVRLIGSTFIAPGFTPTGSFTPFAIPLGESILSATLTMRAGSLDTKPSPVGPGANAIVLNGLAVDPAFFSLFNANDGFLSNLVETHSIALDPTFFAALSSGNVSLLGTNVTERSGSGSFQIDFLRLDITTTDMIRGVPEPSTALGAGLAVLGGLAVSRRRSRRQDG